MLTGNRVTASGRGVNEEIACEKMKDPYNDVGFAFFRDGPLAAPSMRIVIGDYTFWGFKQKRKRRTCIYYGEICDALTNHQICAIVVI